MSGTVVGPRGVSECWSMSMQVVRKSVLANQVPCAMSRPTATSSEGHPCAQTRRASRSTLDATDVAAITVHHLRGRQPGPARTGAPARRRRTTATVRYGPGVPGRPGPGEAGDGVSEQLGALGLVLNCITLWNTLYLDHILDALRAQGY